MARRQSLGMASVPQLHVLPVLAVVVPVLYYAAFPGADAMDAAKEREIIRLWNRLRALQREGQPTAAARKDIEKALAESERDAA